jgi:hypothetical protein
LLDEHILFHLATGWLDGIGGQRQGDAGNIWNVSRIALLHHIDWKKEEEDTIHGLKDSPVATLERDDL